MIFHKKFMHYELHILALFTQQFTFITVPKTVSFTVTSIYFTVSLFVLAWL